MFKTTPTRKFWALEFVSEFGFRISSLGAAMILGWLVSGCATYEAKPIEPAKNAAALESRSLDDPGLRTFMEKNLRPAPAAWPPRAWDFEMLSLAAFYYHPDLEVARAQWNEAIAGVRSAGARPNPTVSVTPGFDTTHNPGLSPWFPAVNFDWPIETAHKREHRIAQASYLSESARLNIATTAWKVRSNVRASLLDYAVASQRESLLQKQIAIQDQIIQLLAQQVQAGAAAGAELAPMRIALQKTRVDLADAQSQRIDARARLAESIGVPVAAVRGLEFAYDLPSEARATDLPPAEIRHQALLGRSDILAALANYSATQAALQLEITKQYPDVHLGPGYQFDQGDDKWSLGLTVELPILDRNQGPIAEARARRAEAAALFNAVQTKVLADIEGALERYQVSASNLSGMCALVDEQAKARDAIDAQVKAGAVAPLDLLNAQLEFAVTEAGQLDGRVKLQQALAALEDAVQRPVETMTAAVLESPLPATKENKP